MTRRRLLGAAAGLGLAAMAVRSLGASAHALTGRPNLLWIITDDQMPSTLGYMPQVGARLVGLGSRFRNGYSAVPLCGPARASLLSGMYPHNHGCLTNTTHQRFVDQGLDQDTVGTRMNDAGYTCGYFGKYMNGHYKQPSYVAPGWNRFVVLFGSETGAKPMFSGLGRHELPIAIDGQIKVITQSWGNGDKVAAKHLNHFISAHAADPWFAVFAPTGPHQPYSPSPKHADDYDGVAWRPRSMNEKDMSDKPTWMQDLPAQDRREMRAAFEGKVEELQDIDDQIASIIETLATSGQLENTVIMMVSDNGYLLGEHRLAGKKQPYEESAGIPFVVKGPGVAAATAPDALVSQVDLMPTTLAVAGLDPDAGRVLDGRSMVAALSSDDWSGWRRRLLVEHPANGWAMLREAHISFIDHHERGEQELYDLDADPHQRRSIARETETAALTARLTAMRTAAGIGLRQLEEAP